MERKQHLYNDIWKRELGYISSAVALGVQLENFFAEQFHRAGNRKRYGFRLVIDKGQVVNSISGSAVARDLADVLLPVLSENKDLWHKHFAVLMSKDFYLVVIPY